ncbi:hypothetical protein DL96DRAFT_1579169 [Flagelloscypha sp. PMI_526]|nr:hypothetical protein DL96DRAFT_1579169 [Flagelloscypha sp. PMI_526]
MLEPTSEVIAHANEILAEHSAFMDKIREAQKARRRLLHTLESPPRELFQLPLLPASNPSKTPELDSPPPSPIPAWSPPDRPNLPPPKRARVAKYRNYVPEEETIRNDYSQHYVDSGEWPQNFVIGAEPEKRFEEYVQLPRLLCYY